MISSAVPLGRIAELARCRALGQANRGQACALVTAEGSTKSVTRLVAAANARRRDGDGHPGSG